MDPKGPPPHQWGSRKLEEVRAVRCAAVAYADTQAPYVLQEQGAYRHVRKDCLELVGDKMLSAQQQPAGLYILWEGTHQQDMHIVPEAHHSASPYLLHDLNLGEGWNCRLCHLWQRQCLVHARVADVRCMQLGLQTGH